MKNLIATLLSLAAIGAVHAQEAALAPAMPPATPDAAPAPASPLTWNLGAITDYRYRGISQTRLHPAVQGGVDYVDADSGLYAGTWLSSITWAKDAGGGGHVEMDVYAGKRGEIAGFAYDVGVLGYVYPGNGLKDVPGFVNGNTGEVYAQVGQGPYYVKYSNALTNLFGFVDSRYSSYLDVGANLDAGNGFTIVLHAGRQHVQHSANASYTDWKAGVSRAWGPVTATLAFVATNAQEAAYTSARNGKFLGKNGVTLQVVRTF
ncbi:TorF family putative porin [uncultured Massilia sp.]|uniref:TorF family putative porin n=1 Tax=uncultured Massilia sp. TaxID=169973 RepID=UPI0025FBC7DF|nr:TorF family putative porin [uncultured Massilia sp.]